MVGGGDQERTMDVELTFAATNALGEAFVAANMIFFVINP